MMNELETQSRRPVGKLRGKPAAKADVGVQLDKCLVVSADNARREMISLAANEAGWDTIVCADEPHAMAAVSKTRFQMAWVDLDIPTSSSVRSATFRDLCESVAAMPNVLLVVCGQVNDSDEEIWARKLGVWLYLPGLSLDHSGEISLLCEQAQLASGKSNNSS